MKNFAAIIAVALVVVGIGNLLNTATAVVPDVAVVQPTPPIVEPGVPMGPPVQFVARDGCVHACVIVSTIDETTDVAVEEAARRRPVVRVVGVAGRAARPAGRVLRGIGRLFCRRR